ncbi:MAG: hypothetical protein KDI63_12885 [Gammaproteobacteria bacterium]|nr:hypothetical protein [Gammaproteobacteria bacterium]
MKGVGFSNNDRNFLAPWIIGAGGWCLLTVFLLDTYQQIGDPRNLEDLFFVLALLWGEFGFAALFNAAYSGRFYRLAPFAAVTLLPPLIVYFLYLT